MIIETTNDLSLRIRKALQLFTLLTVFTVISSGAALAQCNWASGPTAYGTAAASTTSCLPVQAASFTACHYFSEYATFTGLTIGQSYTVAVTNTTTTTGGPFGLGVYTSTTAGTAPLAYVNNATFPISVTFTATATTVYAKSFKSGCVSTGSDCNYFTISCNSCAAPVATTNQPSTSDVTTGTAAVQVLRVDLPVCNTANLTSLTFSTTGTTAPSDISNAKVYFTTSSTFAATTQFGTTVANPNGSFTVTGSQSITGGSTGYLWLTYDLTCNAVPGDTLDAAVTAYTFNGNTASPATTNPTGIRTIAANGSYTATTATSATIGTQNFSMGRTAITGNTCVTTVTQVKFNTSSSVASDISQAKCYYTTSTTFGTTTPFGTAVVNPNGDITFTGSQAVAAGSGNYFWLTYDVSCSAGLGDSLIATPVNIIADGVTYTVSTPATNAKKGVIGVTSYTSASTTSASPGAADLAIGRTGVTGGGCANTVTQVRFNTASSLPAGISQAKCYYTTSTTFSTTTPFGTAVANPNGNITFTGSQALASGNGNYFWLAYNVSCSAGIGDSLVATPVSIIADGITYAVATPASNAKKGITALTSYTATTSTSTSVGSAALSMGRTGITGGSCSNTVTQVKFNTSTSVPADIGQAKCYYTTSTTFSTTTPFGSAVVSPNGVITFTGSQALATGSGNYFWLAYDVSCSATVADSLTAIPVSITADGNEFTVDVPATNAKKGITAVAAPSYTATTSTNVAAGTPLLSMGRTNITGSLCANTVTQVSFNTATSVPADISQAKCFYTTSTTFSSATPFGTAVVSPNGNITFTGSQALATGSGNYFWLAYDVACTAVVADSLIATPVNIIADGTTYTLTTPSPNAKKGITALPAAPAYTATTTTSVAAGTAGLSMGRIAITGNTCNNTVTQVKFNTGTSPVADLAGAKCYYTTSTTFSTAVPFGTAVSNPNGDIVFNGSQALATGSGNYFWLAYDVACSAVLADSLQALPVSITSDGGTATVAVPATNAKKGVTTASATFSTLNDGNWNSPSTWLCGSVPTSTSNVVINNNVTVNTAGNVASNVTIAAGRSLIISGGDLTMGAAGGDKKVFTANGTLNVSGGTFNVNGNMAFASGSSFIQSGGNVNIDGNAAGVTANSVASGTHLLSFATSAVSWTGGTLTIVDPHASTSTSTYALYFNGSDSSVEVSTAHTTVFGNGVSADAGGTTNGFYVNNYVGSYRINLGKVVVNGTAANNRFVTSTYSFPVKGDLLVDNGGELRLSTILHVGGNITVNTGSTLTTSSTLNLVAFSGISTANPVTTPQTISGAGTFRNGTTSTANFASLTVNNTSSGGVTFADANSLLSGSNAGTVSGTFTLTAGTVNVGANSFVLGISPAAAGTYTYTAGMVNGKFKRWMPAATGSNSFDIGTGSGSKKVTINFTTAPTAGGSLTATWNAANPGNNGLPLTEGSNTYSAVSSVGYWTVNAGDGLTGGTYTASFTGTGISDVSDFNALAIAKRATSSDPWTLLGVAVAPSGSNSNFVLARTGLTSFSDFAIININAPLAIKLSSFSGYNAGAVNVLNWMTVSEKGATTFEVLRSADGKKFEKIGTVEASRKTAGDKYSFTDEQPLTGRNLYKLNMTDRNGTSVTSHVVELNTKAAAGIALNVHPNPVTSLMQVSVEGKADGNATIMVMDMSGKVIRTFTADNTNMSIDMSHMPAGIYFVKYVDNSHSIVTKVSKN